MVRVYWVSDAQLDPLLWSFRRIFGYGARGGGKSEYGARKCLACFMRHPRATGQVVSPTYKKSRIIWRKLLRIIPRQWLLPGLLGVRRAERELRFVTGGRIQFLSAHEPSALRGEDLAWVLFDESQDISEEAWKVTFLSLRGAGSKFQLIEVGTAQLGVMYARYLRYCEERDRGDSVGVFNLPARSNVFIDHTIFDDAKSVLDDRTYRQEVLSEWTAIGDRIYYNFDRAANVQRYRHDTRSDITCDFLRAELEVLVERGYFPAYLVGVDYGINHQTAVVYKVTRQQDQRGQTPHVVAEVHVEGGIDDLARELKARGYFPAVIVDDAAGQHCKVGPTGQVVLSRAGFYVTSCGAKNPRIAVRVASMCSRIRTVDGEISYLVDPSCAKLIEAFESQCSGPDGKPDKTSGHDHYLDAAGYPVHRFWPADWYDEEKLKKAA